MNGIVFLWRSQAGTLTFWNLIQKGSLAELRRYNSTLLFKQETLKVWLLGEIDLELARVNYEPRLFRKSSRWNPNVRSFYSRSFIHLSDIGNLSINARSKEPQLVSSSKTFRYRKTERPGPLAYLLRGKVDIFHLLTQLISVSYFTFRQKWEKRFRCLIRKAFLFQGDSLSV